MGHYAKVQDGIVTKVIVAEPSFFDTFIDDSAGEWIQTSYNTRGGVHILGGTPLRKNFAGVNYTYDIARDAFIPPSPFPSWTLNEDTCLWQAPVAYPENAEEYEYKWDEDNLSWVSVVAAT